MNFLQSALRSLTMTKPSPEALVESLRRAIAAAEDALAASATAADGADYATLSRVAADGRNPQAAAASQRLDRVGGELRAVKNALLGGGAPVAATARPHGDESVSSARSSGTSEEDAGDQREAGELARMACEGDLLMVVAGHLRVMGFEARKDAVLIFNNLLKAETAGCSAVDRVCADDAAVLAALLRGYDTQEIALNCGAMLRECLKHEAPTRAVLNDAYFWKFFDLVSVNNFDVASDAFTTFKDLLVRHQDIAVDFVDSNYDKFFEHYKLLLTSDNYVTRRQSLKLLGEMLLERSNFPVMTKFIASADNLKLVMNLLLDNRKNIQFEAFHIFKIFVANPNKTSSVKSILLKNRDKMIAYLSDFLTDRDDEQFQEDRGVVLEEIQDLE
mmetsp:Transcript_38255/g.93793  ORF Transcript_38255/g.93793 Transcript_38255/m.93793 type:complete len:389 (+) Transcript_38255:140-1306(+)